MLTIRVFTFCTGMSWTAGDLEHKEETNYKLFTKPMVEIVLVQLTGAHHLPVNDKLMSPLPFSLD